jgi:acyl-CoA thioesterase FadM
MLREYNKEYKIGYSQTNHKLDLGIYDAFNLSQDTVTEYYESFGGDNIVVKEKDNAIWVTTKARANFTKLPKWRDIVKSKSYTTKIKPIRVNTETIFKNINDELLFVIEQEACVIDLDTRKIRKVDTITYPSDMEINQSLINNDFVKLNNEFTEKDFVYKQVVSSQDIDYSGHTNNAIYVRYIMNAINVDFFDKNIITDFEIHYISESIEGQTLKVYKKELDSIIDFLIKEGDREIIRARLNYKNNKIK